MCHEHASYSLCRKIRYLVWILGVIAQYFFENDIGQAITASSEYLKSMIIKLFWPDMHHIVYVTFERAI